MFDSTYAVTKVSNSKAFPGEGHLKITIYRFDTTAKKRYLIYVTEYPHKFHTIDFCRSSQKDAGNRFTELTGEGDAVRIISTVVKLMEGLLRSGTADLVSFGFIGARMKEESGSVSSKRFRVYRSIMRFLISPVRYEHLEDLASDAYLILHRLADRDQVLAVARAVFLKEEE